MNENLVKENKIVLKPNSKGAAILFVVFSAICVVGGAVFAFFGADFELVGIFVLGALLFLIPFWHYWSLTHLTVIIDEYCITAMNEKTKEAQFVVWEDVKEVYDVIGTKKANSYLLFSNEEFKTKAQVKQIINKCLNKKDGDIIPTFEKNICFCTGFISSFWEEKIKEIAKSKDIKIKEVNWLFKDNY